MEHVIYPADDPRAVALASKWSNLADARIGSKAVFTTDDFFAPKERMLSHETPVFVTNKYDDNGKWMDGWESRRKRIPGHDFCVVRLGLPGIIKAIDIDTSHFTGNFPPEASVEACWSDDERVENADWVEIVPKMTLKGDIHNIATVDDERVFNYIRLNIFPDGGVARLKVFGMGRKDWSDVEDGGLIDLVAMGNGGRAVSWTDAHFGNPANIITPGRGANMGDGWETRRRREPGNDWAILRLGRRGKITRVEIDTAHFKGNYPDRFSLSGVLLEDNGDNDLGKAADSWPVLLAPQKLEADSVFVFDVEVADIGVINHVRLDIYPDGGVSRLRLFGAPDLTGLSDA